MKKVEFTKMLTSEDRMRVSFLKDKGKILKFVIQYYAQIEGRWHTIMRIDNCHGRPHKHVFHLGGEEYYRELEKDPNIAFSGAAEYIKSTFGAIKENFMVSR